MINLPRIFFVMLFLILALPNPGLGAGASRPSRYSGWLAGGYTQMPFDGVAGADFKAFQHYNYDVQFSYQHTKSNSKQVFGLGYASVPGISLQDAQWSNGDIGDYKISFNKTYIHYGINYMGWRVQALYGLENIVWSGSPDVKIENKSVGVPGLHIGWEWKNHGRVTIPLYFRYWSHPSRTLNLQNYPSDSITTNGGGTIELSAAIQLAIIQ
jgi:hypothetical protein